MDCFLLLVLGPALVAGGIVAYRGSGLVYVRSLGAAAELVLIGHTHSVELFVHLPCGSRR